MNDPRTSPNLPLNEVNTLRQRLLELEQAHSESQQQIQQLQQQLQQERAERQHTEAALRASEEQLRAANERFQLAAKAVNCLIYDWNLKLDHVERTDGLTRVLGYSLAEAEPTGKWWHDRVHPEDLSQLQQQAGAVLGHQDYLTTEYRMLNKWNQYVYLLDQCLVVARDEDGTPTRIVGSTTDISDRKRAEAERRRSETDRKRAEAELLQREQEFRAVVENTPDIIVRYDRNLRHLYINPSIERALGIPPDQFIGKTALELGFTDERSQSWYAALQHVFETGQSHAIKYEFPNPKGELRLYQARFVPEVIEAGQTATVLGVATDVTAYKQAEAALRQSEERLRLAMEAAQMGTWDVDLRTGKAFWSDYHFTMLGYDPIATGEASEQMWMNRIHPDDLARVIQAWQQARQEHAPYHAEYRVIRADNQQIAWLAGFGSFTYDPTGQAIRSIGVLFDITHRKQAEAALAQSNQTLQAVIQACPLAIMGLRSDGTVHLWNPAAERIFGWSQQEVLGKFLPAIPDTKQNEFLNKLAASLQGKGLAGIETQRQKKGNILFDVELWTAPVDEEQAGISCVSIVADITQRKRTEAALRLSEERLHSFVTANVIGILFGDLEGGIQEANDEFLRIVGYSREDLQSGKLRWIDITPPEYLPLDEKASIEARSRGACTPYEKEYIRKDGSRVPVFVGFSLAFTVREEAVAFILDLSDRKQAEAEREQLLQREQIAREQAEAANRVKDEFLAVLSHELRTPLNPILGWTRLLRTRSFDSQAVDRALETIERNAKLQAQLIEDLLDVSRILQGKLGLNICPVNLATPIEAALETVRLSAEAKGIQIQTHLDAAVGHVNGDLNRLQQVVWNLLSNAVKFTPSGGRVEVRLAQIGAYAQLQISDTGQGISPDFLPHVFDYFRQADSSTTRQFGGLGLGLAIVRHLVELHGGTVQAASAGNGLGATFTVRLPLMAPPVVVNAETSPLASEFDLSEIKILVVDDDTDTREFVAFVLEQAGAQVLTAASAPEAFTLFTTSPPQLLLSDIGMPEMDGYRLIRQIRALPPDQGGTIPAIALTAFAGEMNQQQALAAGFQTHLAKPVEPDCLIAAIARLILC